MLTVRCRSGEEAFLRAIQLASTGAMTSPRGKSTLEVREPVCLVLDDARMGFITNPYRKLNYAFGLAETLQIWSGDNTLDRLIYYNKNMAKFSDDGITLSGSYGPPFTAQRQYVLDTLSSDRDSRQAVLTIWKPSPKPSRDIPCTVMMHFMIRDFKLNLTVYMRSNDVWLGLPYDMMAFTTIQQAIAASLGVTPGEYRHIAGSLHIYAGDVYKSHWASKHRGPGLCMHKVFAHDLSMLCRYEEDLRHGSTEEMPPATNRNKGDQSAFFKNQAELLLWWTKRKKDNTVIAPEPYATLIELSRSVHAKVAGSKESE